MTAVWQVCYERRGVDYWWDYPPDVCVLLEQQRNEGSNEKIDWACTKPFGRYTLDPMSKVQFNIDAKWKRRMRRVLLEALPQDAETAALPNIDTETAALPQDAQTGGLAPRRSRSRSPRDACMGIQQ